MRSLFIAQLLVAISFLVPSELMARQSARSTKDQTNENITRIEGAEQVSQWCVEETTGRIFALDWKAKLVVEYDRQGKKVNQIQVPNYPQRMIIKGNYLVVAMGGSENRKFIERAPCSLTAIDLRTNTLKKEIPLKGDRAFGLFCSKRDNMLVGGLYSKGSDSWIYQIDLASMSLRHERDIGDKFRDFVNMAMSEDGTLIVGDCKGRSSPSGGNLFSFDEDAFKYKQIQSRHDSFGPISFLPGGRYYLLGDQLAKAVFEDEDKPVRRFGFARAGARVHPTADLIVGSNGVLLTFAEFSTGKELKREKLVLAGKEKYRRSKKRSRLSRADIYFDKNDNVYHCYDNVCQIISLKKIGVETPPLLLMKGPVELVASVGSPVTAKFTPTNSSITNLKYSVVEGPESVSFVNGQFKWAPKFNDLGVHNIKLQVANGDVSRVLDFDVSVHAPSIELDFHPVEVVADKDATHAVCWGTKVPADVDERERRRILGNVESQAFAVVDLVNHKVVVQKQVKAGVSTANIDDQFVYLSAKGANAVLRLDRASLKMDKVQNFSDEVTGIFCLPDGRVIVKHGDSHSFSDSGGSMMDSNFDQSPLLVSREIHNSNPISLNQKPGDLVEVAGRIYDVNSEQFVTSVEPLPFEALSTTAHELTVRKLNDIRYRSNQPAVFFGGSRRFEEISGYGGRAVSSIAPVRYLLTSQFKSQRSRNYDINIGLITCGINNANVFQEFQLTQIPAVNRGANRLPNGRLRVAADKVLVLLPNQLVCTNVPMPEEKIEGPFVLNPPKEPTLNVDKVQKFKVSCSGGEGEIRYGLGIEIPEMEIDDKTGEISIDTPKLRKAFFEKKLRSTSTSNRMRQRSHQNHAKMPNPKIAYQQVFGKELPKSTLPTTLPVSVVATDSGGQQTESTFFFTVLVSVAEIEQAKDKQQKKRDMEKKREQNWNSFVGGFEKAFRQLNRNRPKTRKSEASRSQASRQNQNSEKNPTLDSLEARVSRMEKTADAILKKLDELEKK